MEVTILQIFVVLFFVTVEPDDLVHAWKLLGLLEVIEKVFKQQHLKLLDRFTITNYSSPSVTFG